MFFAQDWSAKSIVNGWIFPWAMEGGFCELSLLGFGDTHDLGVLLIPAGPEIVHKQRVKFEQQNITLPILCEVASPASLPPAL